MLGQFLPIGDWFSLSAPRQTWVQKRKFDNMEDKVLTFKTGILGLNFMVTHLIEYILPININTKNL